MSRLDYTLLGPCLLTIAIDAMGFGLVYPMMSAIFSDPHAGILPADAGEYARNFYLGLGYGLYLQAIMPLLQTKFGYTSARLGLFSGVIGVCFVFGLLFVVRRMLRVWRVVDIAKTGLLVAGLGQILSALFPHEPVPWAFAMVVGCFDMVAYTTMYTAFSDAVSEDRQGWALGVAGSVMVVAWGVTGALTNLLPVFGETGPLLIGGAGFLLSFVMMAFYGRKRAGGARHCRRGGAHRLARFCRTLSCGLLSRAAVRPDTGAARSRQRPPPAANWPQDRIRRALARPYRRSVRCANLE